VSEIKLGVIGGSGLYQMEDLKVLDRLDVDTPFGKASDRLIVGELDGEQLVFLPRHGVGHRVPPSEINFRANIFALKKVGVERIISVSAVGSMKEHIEPGHIHIPNQFIDRTHRRISTFFTDGIVGHVGLADPTCNELASVLSDSSKESGATVHMGGTYICIEGPQFSTRAESNLYRHWGVDIIGMTNVTEAKLAREAGICYATVALVTDFDCWHEEEEAVTVEAVMEIMHKNVNLAQKIIKQAVGKIKSLGDCRYKDAGTQGIITDRSVIPEKLKKDYEILFGKLS
jgi:5'-methylthioadenosine phosphorylase